MYIVISRKTPKKKKQKPNCINVQYSSKKECRNKETGIKEEGKRLLVSALMV